MGSSSLVVLTNGWESGEDSQGQTSANIGTSQATGARTGSYGLACGNGDAWVSDLFQNPLTGAAASLACVGMSFSFYIETWSTATDSPFLAAHRASPNQAYLQLVTTGGNKRLTICEGDSGTTQGATLWTATTNLSTATLYFVELMTYNAAGATATKNWPMRVKLYLNSSGALLDDSGWIFTGGGSTSPLPTTSCALGAGHNTYNIAGTISVVYDDLVVTLGPPPRGAKITSIFPNAVGTDTAWTGDYTAVDEKPPGGDFLTTTTGGQDETHNGPASGLTLTAQDRSAAHNILCVTSWIYANKTAGTIKNLQHRLRTSSGGANSTETLVLSTTLGYHNQMYPVSPLTSNQWTATGGAETDIDALEFGVHSSTSLGAGTLQVDQNFLEIVYGPDFNPASGCTLTTALTALISGTTLVYTGSDVFQVNDLIDLDDEWMVVTAVVAATNTLTVTRGKWTTPAPHAAGTVIRFHPWLNRQRGSV